MIINKQSAEAGTIDAAFAGGFLFTRDTQAIFWNNHQTAVQRMLDYDTLIGRDLPSVAAIVSATGSSRFGKPSASMISSDHRRLFMSNKDVEEASLASLATSPVKRSRR